MREGRRRRRSKRKIEEDEGKGKDEKKGRREQIAGSTSSSVSPRETRSVCKDRRNGNDETGFEAWVEEARFS